MRPSDNRVRLWPVAVIAFFMVAILLSFQTGYRLRENVPGEFRDLPVYGGKPDQKAAEEYWNLAVTSVQFRYGFGTALPTAPPVEFTLPENGKKPGADASKQLYWAQLKRLWVRPEIWKRYYDFDPSWSWHAAQQSVDGVREFFRMSTH